MTRNDVIGSCSAATATLTLGGSVAASSIIATYPHLGSQAVRYTLGALALALLVRARGGSWPRIDLSMAAQLLALTLTGLVGFNLLLLTALQLADSAAIGIVVGAAPMVLALLEPLMQGSIPQRRVLLAALIVTSGAAIAQGGGTTSPYGLLLALGALGCEAAFSLLALPLLPRLGPLVLSTYVSGCAGIILGIAAMLVDGAGALPIPSGAQVTAIAFLGLVVTAGAFVAWYTGVSRLGVARAGLFLGLTPLGALVSSAVTGTAAVTSIHILGAMLVAVGVIVGTGARRTPPQTPPRRGEGL
jgi:drug/metabolite transporter (DMT)-like permease